MNRTIKKIFAIAALTLAFAPALHCEETQTANTSKLQSVINYVKNIRKPLTSQEKLAQHITNADVVGFKNAYNSFQKWPADERIATLQALAITAQEVKQTLQTELENNADTVNKSTLAKGVFQTIGGTILLTAAACYSHILYKHTTLSHEYHIGERIENTNVYRWTNEFKEWKDSNPACYQILKKTPFNCINKLYSIYNVICQKMTPGEFSYDTFIRVNQFSLATFILANIALGFSMKNGIQNCKNGWNYKSYLEQQIDNIDEINEFIQEQQR